MRPPLEPIARRAVLNAFAGSPNVVAQAPARVELLGNHTDHNGGLVLAAAIDRYTVVVGQACEGRQAAVVSTNMAGVDAFTTDNLSPNGSGGWGEYVRGVTWALCEAVDSLKGGFEAAITGEVPLGAGLSSSASLQASFAMFLIAAGVVPNMSIDLDDDTRMWLAKILRRSENVFVGVASGLLDQFSVLFGRAGHALFLDCESLKYDRVPLGDPAPAIIVIDSSTSRQLADGMYNIRRAECEAAVDHFRKISGNPALRNLRGVSLSDLEQEWDRMADAPRRRARHVLTENDRVRTGIEALKAGNVAEFGRLMSASHASSRDDFENSSPALNTLIEAAQTAPGFLGGKLSGAGWAGATVNLVQESEAEAFVASVTEIYAKRSGLPPIVHVCRAAEGASARFDR
jgi:galactokinase